MSQCYMIASLKTHVFSAENEMRDAYASCVWRIHPCQLLQDWHIELVTYGN